MIFCLSGIDFCFWVQRGLICNFIKLGCYVTFLLSYVIICSSDGSGRGSEGRICSCEVSGRGCEVKIWSPDMTGNECEVSGNGSDV